MDKPCECGCGRPAPLSPQKRRGYATGQPQRFIRGHATRGKGTPAYHRLRARDVDQGHETPCRVTTGSLFRTGYGKVRDGTRVRRAHIVVWEHHHGLVPEGYEIDHLCHDPATCAGGWSCPHRACHNIEHLALATHAANVRRGSRHA